jgi:hypothetical protein
MPPSPTTSILNGSTETLGTKLPAQEISTITAGGPPNFADTYITPFTMETNRRVFTWKAQFDCGYMGNGGCGIAVGAQLKVLRPISGSTRLQVIAEGALHNPLAALQAKFGAVDCPFYKMNSPDAVLEFAEAGLAFSAGDIVGLTLKSDPKSQGYFYPLLQADAGCRLVLRNVPVGDFIDLADPYTGSLAGMTPAVLLHLGIAVAIDIQPGQHDNTVHLHSQAVLPVAIMSDPLFDATTIDLATLRLAGAPVETAGGSGKFMVHQQDVNHDGRTDLICDFRASQLSLPIGNSVAVLEGQTLDGVPFRGQGSIKVAA